MGRSDRRTVLKAGLATGAGLGIAYHLGWIGPERLPDWEVRRGAADAEVHDGRTLEDEDNVDYVGDGKVEVVVARARSEPYRTETVPFEEWAERKCMQVAADAVSIHLKRKRPELDRVGSTHGEPYSEEREPGVVIQYVVEGDGSDRVESKPPIGYGELVEITPRDASATVEFEGHEHRATFPVWVERTISEAVPAGSEF